MVLHCYVRLSKNWNKRVNATRETARCTVESESASSYRKLFTSLPALLTHRNLRRIFIILREMDRFFGLLVLFAFIIGSFTAEFEDNFENCHPNVPGFDACVREGLNAVRPYFKTGIAKYNVAPFDPFFAKQIMVSRGLPSFGFTLVLRNVSETGWTASKVTKFVSDLKNYKVVYTQSFPEKALNGDYEFNGKILTSKIDNKGKFTLVLYDLVQTTTITKRPGGKMKVSVDVENIGNLKLHVTNLLQGRNFLENILDRIINGAWQPGFVVTRPIINELVSTAFTDIFRKAFQNFPFDKIIREKPNF